MNDAARSSAGRAHYEDVSATGIQGLDDILCGGLTELIRGLHQQGRTVLMVEHHISVVLGLAQRVAVLHHGTLLACGAPGDVMADETVQGAYLGAAL